MFEAITEFENLLAAYKRAQLGNRYKSATCWFDLHAERELWRLRWELITGIYQPSAYTYFTVKDPKKRRIAAPSFRDRVVHQSLVSQIEPLFEKTFIHDSYACRVNKGSHFGARRVKKFLMAAKTIHGQKTKLYYLQCDIKKFFPSISWPVLTALIEKQVSCPDTLKLIEKIITTHKVIWGRGEVARSVDEVVSTKNKHGLPIGNLTSQLFANVYLNHFDHFAKEQLREPWYSRYMDDFLIISPDKEHLKQVKNQCEAFLAEQLKLTLHPDKSRVFSAEEGIPFVGYRIFPDHVLVRGRTLGRFQKRLHNLQRKVKKGKLGAEYITKSFESFEGHLQRANAWHLQKHLRMRLGIPEAPRPLLLPKSISNTLKYKASPNTLDNTMNTPTQIPLLKIGALAKKTGETTHTLRFWTKEGLLTVKQLTKSGYQLYEQSTAERVKEIRRLQRDKRLKIAEIKAILLP